MKQRVKQFTALILAVALSLSLLSANVWATEPMEDASVSPLSSEEVAAGDDSEAEDTPDDEIPESVECSTPSQEPDARPEESSDECELTGEAETDVYTEENVSDEELSLTAQGVIASGSCGAKLIWTLDDTGTLTISGSGKMKDYDEDSVSDSDSSPWGALWASANQITFQGNITSIGSRAFLCCKNLTRITIPNSVTTIGEFAFAGCRNLISVTIPNSVTTIGGLAFYNCVKLNSIKIPESVTHIGIGAFENCSGLTSITIPDSVTSIGDGAFFGNSSLKSISISNSITTINSVTFSDCGSLSSITIPKSVNGISYAAFSDCENLNSIYFLGNAPQIGADAFNNVTATAYYPANNKTWTTKNRKNYGGMITWKEWNPSINDTDLTPYQKKVLDMVNRTQNKTTLPMHEFHDPNDMILDYLSTSDLSKMVVTETGSHLSSHSMWKEAYYRALDKMTGIDQFVSLLSDADDLFGDYSFIKETLSDSDLGLTSTVITAITSVSKDQIRKYYIDMFALEEIYENTTDKDLQSACRDRMEKRQYELKKAFKKILQDVLSDYDRVTSPALESISSLLAKNSSKKVAVALKSLGYAAEAASYVSAVITVKDIIVKVNGWSDLTESYQNSIADTYICNALRDSYQKQLILYNKSSTPEKLDHLGLTFEHIKLYTQDNYDQMKTILGKKYKSVVKSDDYLKQRINLVEALSIDTYKSTNVQYMKPKLNVSGYLYMEVGGMVAFSVLNTRYGAQIELQSKNLISSKVLSLDKGCIITAKNVGRAKVKVRVKQNGGQYYPMSFEVIVNPRTPNFTKIANKKKNNAVMKWKKGRSITGYIIQYSTNKKFKKEVRTITVKKAGTTSLTVKKLKKGQTYYFRICSYKKTKNKTYTSGWSKKKTLKIEK